MEKIHDKRGRQIAVGDEVIFRGFVEHWSVPSVLPPSIAVTIGGVRYWFPANASEKVASDPGPFLTNDMPVKGNKCAG